MALVYRGGRAGMGDFKSFLKGAVGAAAPGNPLANVHINAQTGASVGRALASGAKQVAGSAIKNLLLGKQGATPQPHATVNYTPWLLGGGVAVVAAIILMRRK